MSETKLYEQEACDFITKRRKLIEILTELFELEEDEDKLDKHLSQIWSAREEIESAACGEKKLRGARRELEHLQKFAKEKIAADLAAAKAATESRNNAKAEVLNTSAVLQMLMDLVDKPDQERRRAKKTAAKETAAAAEKAVVATTKREREAAIKAAAAAQATAKRETKNKAAEKERHHQAEEAAAAAKKAKAERAKAEAKREAAAKAAAERRAAAKQKPELNRAAEAAATAEAKQRKAKSEQDLQVR